MTKRQDPKGKKSPRAVTKAPVEHKKASYTGILHNIGSQGGALQKATNQQRAGFKKGQSGNPKGREPGSKNYRTLEWETFGKAIVEGNLEWMQEHLDNLKETEPDKAFEKIVDLMEYFKPKLSRQEQKHEGAVDVKVTHKWGE